VGHDGGDRPRRHPRVSSPTRGSLRRRAAGSGRVVAGRAADAGTMLLHARGDAGGPAALRAAILAQGPPQCERRRARRNCDGAVTPRGLPAAGPDGPELGAPAAAGPARGATRRGLGDSGGRGGAGAQLKGRPGAGPIPQYPRGLARHSCGPCGPGPASRSIVYMVSALAGPAPATKQTEDTNC
jgi:hypothetical protein